MSEAGRLLDEYLVACAKGGDRNALERLAGRWQARLVAHARRLTGDAELGRDAAQESWIEILHGMARLRDERAFPAWAYRIVSRRCARLIARRQSRRALDISVACEPREDAIVPDAGSALDHDRLRHAVRLLPPGQRAAVALFHVEELSIAEVAVALDVPAGTVKTRLMHARRKLRSILEGE